MSADKLPDNLKFRSDYTYNPKTDAYYKVHVDQNQWSLAKSLCKVEGSRLMITTFENRVFAHSLYKRLIDIEDKFWVETKDEFEEEEAHRNDEGRLFFYCSTAFDPVSSDVKCDKIHGL